MIEYLQDHAESTRHDPLGGNALGACVRREQGEGSTGGGGKSIHVFTIRKTCPFSSPITRE